MLTLCDASRFFIKWFLFLQAQECRLMQLVVMLLKEYM